MKIILILLLKKKIIFIKILCKY